MGRLLKGLGALFVMGLILIGTPVALVQMVGNPIPSLDQLQSIISLRPDFGNEILLTKILPLMCWVAWLFFAIPFVIEIFAAIAGIKTTKRAPLFKGQQRLASSLIAAVAVMFGGLASAAPASAATPVEVAPAASVAYEVAPPVAVAPVAVEQAPAGESVNDAYVVQSGDTLFGIAEAQLGDGDRYPEIFTASQGAQADGGHLSDTDLIYPGWEIEIPGVTDVAPAAETVAAPAAPAEVAAPVDTVEAPSVGAEVAAPVGEVAASVDESVVDAVPEAVAPAVDAEKVPSGAVVDVDESFPLSTVGGVGGVLAAGLLATLGARRLLQRRKRSRGAVLPMPEGAVADLELELRVVEIPIVVADVDNALRTLQIWAEDTGNPLPELLAVRVADDEASFYLSTPGDMPDPFELIHPDRTAWILRPGRAIAPSREAISPYPALVTIGTAGGGVLMLDLEQLGSINIVGDETIARGMLNAIAAELAVNPWTEQTQVTLVGLPVGLVQDVGRFQVQHVDDVEALLKTLRAEVVDRQEALASYDVDNVKDGRVEASDEESWAPHIVLLGVLPEQTHREELEDLVMRLPRLGLATVANGVAIEAGATIRATDRETAEYISGGSLPALPFKPQLLEGEELELLQSLMVTAKQDPAPAPAERDLEENAVVDAAVEDAVGVELVPTIELDAEAEEQATDDPATVEEPTEVVEPATVVERALAPVAEVTPLATVPSWPAPYLRLLGPIEALNVPEKDALPGRAIELLAFLHLQGEAVPGALVQKKMWPDKYDPKNNNTKTLARQVRVALGSDPDGELLLPTGRKDIGLTLHPMINSDWADFQRLIGPDLSITPTSDLIAAVRLVRGEPFDGAAARRGWWVWRTPYEAQMHAAVLDAADELTSRALAVGDIDNARLAGRMAQSSDPLNEAGWRMEIRAAMASNDKDAFNEVIDQMYERVVGNTDVELDKSTQHLISAGAAQLDGRP